MLANLPEESILTPPTHTPEALLSGAGQPSSQERGWEGVFSPTQILDGARVETTVSRCRAKFAKFSTGSLSFKPHSHLLRWALRSHFIEDKIESQRGKEFG